MMVKANTSFKIKNGKEIIVLEIFFLKFITKFKYNMFNKIKNENKKF